MSNKTETKTVIIRDLEIHWANVYTPHSPFGTEIWDIQIRTDDEKKAKEIGELGISLKQHDDGYYFGNVKRKTISAKGEPLKAPEVIDSSKAPVTAPIGNGSKGNIKVFSYPYKVGARSGISAMLLALQITDLVPYANSEDDFDVIIDDENDVPF